jgi:hypothetical protein
MRRSARGLRDVFRQEQTMSAKVPAISIARILAGEVGSSAEVTVQGWLRTRRDSKAGFSFVGLHDGSCFDAVQVVAPATLENYQFLEKITHFDHERIPERVVHARGAGAHGVFRGYGTAEQVCKAAFLGKDVETPVFVRFSTVLGSRGSADTVRDTRGFATKFYTEQGVFDLVGNNIPVFFIQDGIKFPDVIHAGKPHPDREIPQAQSAHDTFWDFVSLHTEATHHTLWNMSDRGIPRSYRMMEGFGVHTFRLVNAEGATTLVKWHWKPQALRGGQIRAALGDGVPVGAGRRPGGAVGVGPGLVGLGRQRIARLGRLLQRGRLAAGTARHLRPFGVTVRGVLPGDRTGDLVGGCFHGVRRVHLSSASRRWRVGHGHPLP